MDGAMVGKPTFLATLPGKQDARAVLDALKAAGYPLDDVAVYYRLSGTDQVLDALTGEVAAGQSLNARELDEEALAKMDTLVLLHPDAEQAQSVQAALAPFNLADVKYQGQTEAGGRPDEAPTA